uniref:GDP-fucose protein O-fucosyltransferase 2 n=1 Tax=Chromera velia CCMP2878 TaxID=1169474 RepID=A0A0G4I572_9ALVE|eukprot:Cvel_1826.t1-p1 / transcript=Cvel_1826.t1 / gene=Cvel_1826 / organism=Chromera_velia_CCMP2878 / gene_product=GDP-fucose protein O-fucosyltransferase 2, putative / transcript_product=GDP-fucose protein O-fucosyltransferase 2, putative / location=Cvel_scaffold67:86597-94526(-) / protein_length=588 / sequence_SO=supercontig / SO=protein_coding / is_pseudo=false
MRSKKGRLPAVSRLLLLFFCARVEGWGDGPITRYGEGWGDQSYDALPLQHCPNYMKSKELATFVGRNKCDARYRFLLYDVKIGEGFNLQKNVFYRFAYAVRALNDFISSACAVKGGDNCVTWVLVLPPWCRVVHWLSERETRLKWSAFFDLDVARQALPVIDFDDFTTFQNGGLSEVDIGLTANWEPNFVDKYGTRLREELGLPSPPPQPGGGGRRPSQGEPELPSMIHLRGFVACLNRGPQIRARTETQCLPSSSSSRGGKGKDAKGKEKSGQCKSVHVIDFSGYCGQVAASETRCIPMKNAPSGIEFSNAVLETSAAGSGNLPAAAKKHKGEERRTDREENKFREISIEALQSRSIGSIFFKNGDNLMVPFPSELAAVGVEGALFFSQRLREKGETFIRRHFPEGKFISAHVRRRDFASVRSRDIPTLSQAGERLKAVAKQKGADKVFVCTDGDESEKETIRRAASPVKVFFFDEFGEKEGGGQSRQFHPGETAIVEQWIAARSLHFIGTAESTFSREIMTERGILGYPKESVVDQFCDWESWEGNVEKEKKKGQGRGSCPHHGQTIVSKYGGPAAPSRRQYAMLQ